MKSFLLTLKYPYTGHESIDYLRVTARTMQAAMNKARKQVRQIYAAGCCGGVSILHCEEITSCADLWQRKATVDAELIATREKLKALEIEQLALKRICAAIKA